MVRFVSVVLALVWIGAVYAQAPAVQPRVYANMLQVMRGTLYPQSNVIFTAQVEDPASFKPATHPSTSSDPFTSVWRMGGGREQRDGAGRDGQPPAHSARVRQRQARARSERRLADVGAGAPRCRDGGVYKAGQAKNDDVVLEAADKLATACLHCHAKYRNVPGGIPNRC